MSQPTTTENPEEFVANKVTENNSVDTLSSAQLYDPILMMNSQSR